jgi:hypothetical protein
MYRFPETFTPNPSRVQEIEWYHYKDGLKRAEAENKLILMVISASWCYWCHILDETTLSDERILSRLKGEIIPVRVDADREPDIEARYSQEGLPSVLILSPHGITLGGGNFFSAQELEVLINEAQRFMETQRKAYFEHKEEIEKAIENFRTEKRGFSDNADLEKVIKDVIIQAVVSLDSEVPGFSIEPKFPHPAMLDFMLTYSELDGEEELLELPQRILDAMLDGKMFDEIDGGFFRYARGRDWTDPQTDKHLYDNAHLVKVFAKAYRLTKNPVYKDVAIRTVDYLDFTLRNSNLYGISQDADDAYYALSREERKKYLPPRVDMTPISGYNARLVEALSECALSFNDPVYEEKAQQIIDSVLENYINDSQPNLPIRARGIDGFFLQDTSEVLNSFLGVSRISRNEILLEHAKAIYSNAKEIFYDERKLLFLDRQHSNSDEGALRLRYAPFNENCLMAQVIADLVRFGVVSEEELEIAENIVSELHGALKNSVLFRHRLALPA